MNYSLAMADDHFLKHSEEYVQVPLGNRTYLINQHNQEAPVYQLIQIVRSQASFLGNYVNQDSSIILFQKVDPLLVAVEIMGNKFSSSNAYQELHDLLLRPGEHQLSDLASYLSKRPSLESRMELVAKVLKPGDTTFFQLDKEKLFVLLDQKIEKMDKQKMLNRKLGEGTNMEMALQYLNPELQTEYKKLRDKMENTVHLGTQEVLPEVQKQQSEKKKPQKISASELKNQQASKQCMKLDMFCQKKSQP